MKQIRIINQLILNIIEIKTNPCTTISISIKLKNLIKDCFFENMKNKEGIEINYKGKKIGENRIKWNLPQTFLETENKIIEKLEHPFFLIPLLKIRDMNEKEIQFNFFEKEIGNNIRYSPLNNSYYIRFQTNFSYNEKSLILKIKNEIFYLSKNIEIYRNGYLILKDQNSNSSMLYVGIFININYNNILYNLLKQFILKNEINEEIKPEDIIIELLINLSDVNKTMELYFKENNNKHKFKLIYSNKYNKILPLKFIFKGNIKENEFYFNIINDKIIENNFIKLIPISSKAKDYYLNFLINNN